MQVVYPVIDDSLAFMGDEMMYAETDVIDSVALDSARAAAGSFQYNNDQKFYNWYFKEKLVWKDELLGESASDFNQPALAQADTTSKVPFFQRIFGTPEEKAAKKAEKEAAKAEKEAQKAQQKEQDSSGSEEEKDDGF